MKSKLPRRTAALLTTMALCAVLLVTGVTAAPSGAATVDPCGAGGNAVACENTKPGSPEATWDTPNPSTTIEGYATDTSVNVGGTINFKIKTPSTGYRLDIYRIGYYGGNGARLITSVNPSASLPQTQPACINDANTGLVDCGNWKVSASWAVPSTAVSGVYEAKLVRTDSPGLNNQIMFVVRNDASHSDLTFQTSDTTWQAYNSWGGNSLYVGNPDGRAYKVSFNRPYNTRTATPNGQDFFFSTEYPMVRFLEANGYDISYQSGLDTDRSGSLLLNHKTFLSVGHDEYWSGAQRANVEAARDAGVNLAFFSGNIALWKTRYESSIDGSSTPNRTLVSYKETKNSAKIDPTSTWTGTWRDPRFSPPSDGGRPENALTGTLWMVQGTDQQMTVPAEAGKLRLWRNTSMATLATGTTGTLPLGVLGYEYDVDVDNGFRPAGEFDLSSTTNDEAEVAQDLGASVGPATATHSLTQYRASSGALVFSAGTIQWAMGLDSHNDGDYLGWVNETGDVVPSQAMKQATVNVLADMSALPVTLDAALTTASKSTDTTAPTSTITSPNAGASFTNGSLASISGTAADVGGHVAGVEVSLDGGTTWHPAKGRGNWTYTGSFTGTGPTSVKVRAVDDSGNLEVGGPSVAVTVGCPCSIFGLAQQPVVSAENDASSVALGVQFQTDISGWITGVRFYKGAGNTGTHVGSLWSAAGQRLATATFTGESASGWQQANFAVPVAVTAGTTYVASYYAPNGHYAADNGDFSQRGSASGPVRALSSPAAGGNGVFAYGGDLFPATSYSASNYWVDAVLSTTASSTSGPSVIAQTPAPGAANVATSTAVSATFDQSVQPSSAVVTVTGPGNVAVPGSTVYTDATKTVKFTPTTALSGNASYAVSVTASSLSGIAMASPAQWSFTTAGVAGTCPCSLFSTSPIPATPSVNDTSPVEVGVRFSSDRAGQITGLRFYKGSSNVGTHIGTLWSSTGTQLARATFTSESASGWQQVNFATPVSISAGVTYIASYHTSGFYSATAGGFSTGVDNAPLHAPADQAGAPNGVYTYGSTPTFPNSTYASTNYSVDVVFSDATDTTKPTVVSKTPAAGATGVATSSTVKAVMSERLQPSSSTVTVTGPSGSVAGTTSYDDATTSVTFSPSALLAASSTYNVTLSGATDLAGNVIAAPVSWTFATAAPDTTKPTVVSTTPSAGATGVATSSTVKAVMSERLQPSSSTVTVTGPSGSVAGSTSYDDATTSVTFSPSALLAASSTYNVTLSGATDLAGNVIAAPVSWTFATAAAPTTVTLFNGSDVPAVTASTDTGNLEIGVRFTPDVNGTVTGVKFYKGTGNTGTHTGTLWSSTGAQLATGTFAGESATGWQTLTFTTPVSVTAGQTYTASYHAPVGRYAYTSAYFGSQLDRAPLHALATSNGGNGVYLYGARAFPASTFNATNYWVDVVFAPVASGGAVASGATVSALDTTTSVVSAFGATGLVADVPKVTQFVGPFFLSSTTS